jgi:signal transduction histidine kinase
MGDDVKTPREAPSILLVDDAPGNLLALEAVLEPLRCRLVSATSGRDAVRCALDEEFAVILMDVMMPILDGFQTAALLKQRELSRHTPIIFLTALGTEHRYLQRGYAEGAVDYLTKPYDADVLRAKVLVFVELFRKGEEVKRQAALLLEREREAIRFKALEESELRFRHLAEERLQLIAALQRSNRELDQFAYVASHDLKAPLRGIANLSQWLEDDLGETISGDAREKLRLLRRRVTRLESLIQGILDYSRAGRIPRQPVSIDVGKLLTEVIELLAPSNDAAVKVASEMPSLRCTLVPLEQVFMNLIGNALKHARRSDPKVTIEAADAGAFVCFSISDNGPGIAKEHHETIWEVFRTLESRDTVEGTGIGLSVVKKIVESRGGRAWVESRLGSGATFYFLWPKDEAAS